MGEVQLFGAFPSPFSSRVEWALMHKGIAYEYIEEDLQNKSPLLLQYNPVCKKIPVLVHGGKPIIESLVILEYIEETWKENSLLPKDPFERAKARFWAKFADEKCAFSIWTAFRTEAKEQEKSVEASLEALKALDEEVEGKEFFGGERIGLVDIVLGWIPHWLPVLDEVTGLKLLDADAFPSLQTWGHRLLNIQFIKETLPPLDKMLSSRDHMMEEVKLMGALPSLYSCRVEWALTLKGIKYEYIEEDLLNKSSLLLKHNPIHKKVPVMLHGGKSIAESLIILEYMEEKWKQNPLLPQDPLEKANARFWAKFADEKVAFPIWTAFLLKGQEQEKAMETPLQALKSLDEDLKGKKFFGGKSIGLVDLVVGWIPHWVPVIEKVLGLKLLGADSFPSLYAWTERFLNVPFIREKLPPSDRLLAFYTTIRKELLNK